MKKSSNEKGQLTLEFMLALILIVTVSTLLGILTFTLSLTEVLQYVTYAGARSYLAADMATTDQVKAGTDKAQELLTSLPFLSAAQASGWITIPPGKSLIMEKPAGDAYADLIGADRTRHDQFEGLQIQFTVPMLNVKIPFLSSAIAPPDGGQDFKATLSSFLTREPSFNECQRYMAKAYEVLVGSYGCSNCIAPKTVFIDNGC